MDEDQLKVETRALVARAQELKAMAKLPLTRVEKKRVIKQLRQCHKALGKNLQAVQRRRVTIENDILMLINNYSFQEGGEGNDGQSRGHLIDTMNRRNRNDSGNKQKRDA